MNVHIEAPHFVAGCHNGTCAPIIKYMETWPIEKIRSYCLKKGWKLTTLMSGEHLPQKTSLKGKELNLEMNGFGNNDYTSIFGTIGRAKSMGGGFTPRIGIGNHRLALKSYKVRDSVKGQGQFLEAEFVVVESTTHKPGELRGWAWFINASGQWAAAYEQDRAKKFLEAVGACVGDTSSVEVIGANLAGADQAGTGLVIDCTVALQGGKNAGKTNSKGEPYTNIYWNPVKQTLDELAASRAEVESITPPPAPEVTQTAPKTGGLFGRK